jgi:hypothetical protein
VCTWVLDFSLCRSLKKIPEGFGGLRRLNKLDMQECEALEEFPPGVTNLCALEELDFSKCRSLKKIPEGFGGLTSLKKLDMWKCEALLEFPPRVSKKFVFIGGVEFLALSVLWEPIKTWKPGLGVHPDLNRGE